MPTRSTPAPARAVKRASGFTLIELMIVVAIIGILAAIAIPNFTRMQTKARQSEAKVSLKAYFTAAKAYFAENNLWVCGDCGWGPEDKYIYNYFLSPTTEYNNGTGGCDAATIDSPVQSNPDNAVGSPGGFTAGAAGNIDGDPICDGWNINDANNLTNMSNDVELR